MSADCGLRGLDLLDAVIAHIEQHPETWKQDSYRCETGMCVAGRAAVLAGGRWAAPVTDGGLSGHRQCMVAEPGDDPADIERWECGAGHIHVSERADRLLGVTRYPDDRDLFAAENSLDDIKAIRDGLRARATAVTT